MPSKLETLIAQITAQSGDDDGCSAIHAEVVGAAAKAAPQLTPADLAKFPDLWYPTVSAKGADAIHLKEGWGRLWFETLVELLYQAGPDHGLPILFELWDRDLKTYHGMVLVRLLRFAAGNVRKKEILDKVKSRLPVLANPSGPESVDEVMLWAYRRDLRLMKLLKSLAKIKLKGIGEQTVGSVMKEWAESRGLPL